MWFTAVRTRPVFLGQAPIAERVLAAAYLDSSAVRAPWLSLPEPMAMRHPQFLRDVSAFAADLRRTGQLGSARADSIARIAVREAYHRRIPPALVLGGDADGERRLQAERAVECRRARPDADHATRLDAEPRAHSGPEPEGRRDEPPIRRLHPQALRQADVGHAGRPGRDEDRAAPLQRVRDRAPTRRTAARIRSESAGTWTRARGRSAREGTSTSASRFRCGLRSATPRLPPLRAPSRRYTSTP